MRAFIAWMFGNHTNRVSSLNYSINTFESVYTMMDHMERCRSRGRQDAGCGRDRSCLCAFKHLGVHDNACSLVTRPERKLHQWVCFADRGKTNLAAHWLIFLQESYANSCGINQRVSEIFNLVAFFFWDTHRRVFFTSCTRLHFYFTLRCKFTSHYFDSLQALFIFIFAFYTLFILTS